MVLNDALEKLQAIFRILIGQSAEAEWFREKSKSDFVSDSDWVVHLLKIHKCHCCHGCIETSLSTTAHQTDANIVIANRTESQSNKADHPISSNAINFRSHVPPQSVLDSHETDKIPPSTPNSEPVKRRIISTSESDDVSLKKKSKRKRRSPCHLPRDDEGEERDQISMDSASPACSVEDNMAPEEDCHQMSRSVRDDAGAAVYMDVATDTTALQASSLQDKHEKISIKEEQVDEDGRYGNMPGMVSDGSGTDPVVRVKMEPETDYESFNIHESRYLNVNNGAPYVTNINYIAPLSNKEEPQFQCFQVPTCETEMTSRTSNIDTFSGRTAVLQDPQPQSSIQSQSLPLGHDFQAAMRLQAMASQSVSDSLPNKISQSFHLQDYQAVSHLSAHEQLQRLRSQDPSPFNQTNYDELIKSLLQSSVSVPNSQQISPDIQAPPLAEHETRLSRRLKDRQKIEMYSLHESDSVPEKSMKSHSLLRSMLFPKVQVSSPATTAHQYRASSARAQLVSLLQMQNTRQSSHEMPLHIDMDQDSQSLSQSSTGHSPHNPSSDSSMLKTLLHERDLVATMHDQSSQHGLSAYEPRMQFRKKGVGMKSDKHVTEAALEGAKIDDVKSSPLADLLNSATCSVNDMLIQKLANKLPVSHTIVNESVKSSSNPTLPIDNTSRSYEDGQIGNISSLLEVSLPYSFNSRTGHDEDSATKTPVLSSLLSLRTTTTSDAAASSSRYMEELLRDRRLSPTHSTRIMSTSADPDPDCSIIPYPEDFTSTPVTSSLASSRSLHFPKTAQLLKNRLTSSQATSSPSHEDPGSSSRADAQSFLYSLANLSPHVSTSADAHRLTTNTISANSVAQRSSTSGLLVSYLNQISNSEPVNKHSIKSEVDNWAVMCQNNSLHDHTSDISGHNFSENTADLNSTHSYNTRRAQGTSWNREFTYNDSDDDDDEANSSADSFAAKTFMKTFDYKDYDENDDDGISTSNDDKDADYVPDEYEDDFKDS